MRVLIFVAIAGAIGIAAPAMAQNNAAAANAAATNESAPLNAMTSMPAGPTTPGGQPTTLPPTASSPAARGTAPIVAQKTGFPWGVLGLIGLLGFFGRKRSS
jgi:hypothetical protein